MNEPAAIATADYAAPIAPSPSRAAMDWVRAHADGTVLVAALLLSFVVRIPFLLMPLTSDEGGYAYAAKRWVAGQGRLYHDLYIDRPQGIFLFYALIEHTLGTGTLAIRLGAWIATALTLFAVWLIAKEGAVREVAAVATIAFALLASSPTIEGFTANSEVFMALPAAWCALLLLRASRRDWPWRPLVLAGFLATAAALTKQSGIVMAPVGGAFILRCLANRPRRLARACLLFALGGLVATAPALLHGWMLGWNAYLAAVVGRAQSRSALNVTWAVQVQAIILLVKSIMPVIYVAIVVLLARLILVRAPKRMPRSRRAANRLAPTWPLVAPGTELTALLRLWGIGALVGISMSGDWYKHYIIQMAAPLAIWIGMQLQPMRGVAPKFLHAGIVVTVATILLTQYQVAVTTRANANKMAMPVFGRDYSAEYDVGNYVRAHTGPTDTIYVTYYHAGIYYLADRPSAYPYLYLLQLLARPNAETELIARLQAPDHPIYVIDAHQWQPFPNGSERFWATVHANYQLETSIDGIDLYRANDAT
jgi:4-amino-4-deoxy-L-arabinose transferase-like glycosyltransferase